MALNADNRGDFNEACRFIEELVRASQLYGVSSRGMVASLSRIVKALGLHGEFLATPNYVHTVLWGEDEHQQRVHLAVSRSGNFDLAKLTRVSKLTRQVEAGSIRPAEGLARLREIVLAPDEYGPLLNALAFMVSGAAFAVIIGTSWLVALLGGLVALASYGITLVAARSAGIAALQEILAAMMAAVLASAATEVFPGINPMAVTVCAVIWFVPGFGLTIAPSELITGNTLSGIIWLTNAVVAALKLLFGAAIGVALAKSAGFSAESVSPAGNIAPAWKWVAVPALIIALAVLMKVDWRQFWGILLGGWLVWGAVQLGNPFGFWQGTFLGATALMIYANWYGRRFSLPSAVILLPCVMVLVPGFAALNALHAANAEGVLAGFKAGSDVLVLIVAIIGGTFVGEALALHNLVRTGKVVKSWIESTADLTRKDRGE